MGRLSHRERAIRFAGDASPIVARDKVLVKTLSRHRPDFKGFRAQKMV